MDTARCPGCGTEAFAVDMGEGGPSLFDIEPQRVYLPETGDIMNGQVEHQCAEGKQTRGIIVPKPESP